MLAADKCKISPTTVTVRGVYNWETMKAHPRDFDPNANRCPLLFLSSLIHVQFTCLAVEFVGQWKRTNSQGRHALGNKLCVVSSKGVGGGWSHPFCCAFHLLGLKLRSWRRNESRRGLVQRPVEVRALWSVAFWRLRAAIHQNEGKSLQHLRYCQYCLTTWADCHSLQKMFHGVQHGGKASPLLFGGHDQFPSDVDKARLNHWQSPRGKNSVNIFLQHVAQNIVFSRRPLIFTSSREWEPMWALLAATRGTRPASRRRQSVQRVQTLKIQQQIQTQKPARMAKWAKWTKWQPLTDWRSWNLWAIWRFADKTCRVRFFGLAFEGGRRLTGDICEMFIRQTGLL